MKPVAERLLLTPTPVDRVAARVVKKAAPENLWRPLPSIHAAHAIATLPLAVAKIPPSVRHDHPVRRVIGGRRGRMTVVGYAADQPENGHRQARWVARCDCGNYEHRVRILRWLATQADDMCAECRNRAYIFGRKWDSAPAVRLTVESTPGA